MIIVIDDERTFYGDNITYFRDGQTAMIFFAIRCSDYERYPVGSLDEIEEIWFDHDLGPNSNFDGVTVARFVQLMKAFNLGGISNTKIFVHSQNPIGAQNILDVFQHTPDVNRVWLPKQFEDSGS